LPLWYHTVFRRDVIPSAGQAGSQFYLSRKQWQFYVRARGAIVPPVFGFAPPVWHDAAIIVTANNITPLFVVLIETLENGINLLAQ